MSNDGQLKLPAPSPDLSGYPFATSISFPESGALALAGLGGLSLWLFRRRK
ncbi:MAG: hypothetical protein ABSD57_10090 [Verrucomicrobiota bacterium]